MLCHMEYNFSRQYVRYCLVTVTSCKYLTLFLKVLTIQQRYTVVVSLELTVAYHVITTHKCLQCMHIPYFNTLHVS